MTDYTDLATTYIATWNERDPDRRRTQLERHWAADARYCDPLGDVLGHAGLDATIAGVQATFPDFEFRLLDGVDGHHDQCRFRWELGPAGAEAPVAGFDVVHVDSDGRITSVAGFLDRVPATM